MLNITCYPKMQIKTTRRQDYTPTELAIVKKLTPAINGSGDGAPETALSMEG